MLESLGKSLDPVFMAWPDAKVQLATVFGRKKKKKHEETKRQKKCLGAESVCLPFRVAFSGGCCCKGPPVGISQLRAASRGLPSVKDALTGPWCHRGKKSVVQNL